MNIMTSVSLSVCRQKSFIDASLYHTDHPSRPPCCRAACTPSHPTSAGTIDPSTHRLTNRPSRAPVRRPPVRLHDRSGEQVAPALASPDRPPWPATLWPAGQATLALPATGRHRQWHRSAGQAGVASRTVRTGQPDRPLLPAGQSAPVSRTSRCGQPDSPHRSAEQAAVVSWTIRTGQPDRPLWSAGQAAVVSWIVRSGQLDSPLWLAGQFALVSWTGHTGLQGRPPFPNAQVSRTGRTGRPDRWPGPAAPVTQTDHPGPARHADLVSRLGRPETGHLGQPRRLRDIRLQRSLTQQELLFCGEEPVAAAASEIRAASVDVSLHKRRQMDVLEEFGVIESYKEP